MKKIILFLTFIFLLQPAFAEYKAQYINELKQFGSVNYTLLMTDTKKVMPDVRLYVSYPEKVTQKELDDAVAKAIVDATTAYNTPKTITISDFNKETITSYLEKTHPEIITEILNSKTITK
jgi:hypothetical protein